MLKNYLITALRNLTRQRGTTVLNLLGLTMGIAASLVLFLLTRYHEGFDQYHSKKDRIYRVVTESSGNSGQDYSPGVPPVLPDAFKLDFQEAEEVAFTSYGEVGLITIPQSSGEPKKFEEKRGVVFTSPSFFRIFDITMIAGDPEKGLDEPQEAIISRSLAMKFFGKEDVIGEVLNVDNRNSKLPFKITAVMEDPPAQTDLPFSLILSEVTIKKEQNARGWNSTSSDDHCYFLLKEGESVETMAKAMPAFVKKHITDTRETRTFNLQPLQEIHFDDRYGTYNYKTISRQTLLALTLIGIFLILTASINFINLSTAEAIKRSREVGIRKALGSSRQQLIFQFLGEAALVTFFSGFAALAVGQLSLGWLNGFLDVRISLGWADRIVWVYAVSIMVLVSLFSGLYPAFVLSAFNPITALKNQTSSLQSSGFNLRRMLVVLQFLISQFLVIGTIVLITQLNYFQGMELGFSKDAILTIPIPVRETPVLSDTARPSTMRTLRDEINRLSGVEKASLCNAPPSSAAVSSTGFTLEGNSDFFETQVKTIDSNYVSLFHLPLVAGRNVEDRDTASGFIVNEKLAAMTGFQDPADIIGKHIQMWGKNLPVVGVVRNFHTVSLHNPIEATILLNRIRNYRSLSVKVNPSHMTETISQIRKQWEAAYPEFIFSYEFLDETVREFYETEQKNSMLLGLFTSLAILIGCLGLFGLASFMANQKVKEIGIRKVLGASVESILVLFSKEFVILILIGFVLAVPLSWFVMNEWLREFAYRISIGPVIFLEGLLVTLLIGLVTVGYRSVTAASANPVQSLRSE